MISNNWSNSKEEFVDALNESRKSLASSPIQKQQQTTMPLFSGSKFIKLTDSKEKEVKKATKRGEVKDEDDKKGKDHQQDKGKKPLVDKSEISGNEKLEINTKLQLVSKKTSPISSYPWWFSAFLSPLQSTAILINNYEDDEVKEEDAEIGGIN